MRRSECRGLLTDSFEQRNERSIDEIFLKKNFASFTIFGFVDDFHKVNDLG